jgi:hypothetical protein
VVFRAKISSLCQTSGYEYVLASLQKLVFLSSPSPGISWQGSPSHKRKKKPLIPGLRLLWWVPRANHTAVPDTKPPLS